MTLKVGMQYLVLEYYQVGSNDDPGMTLTCFTVKVKLGHLCFCMGPDPIAQLVECPLRGMGGHGFDPGPRHTKVVKNGTSCSSLGTQIYGVELGLVDPVSG